MILCMGSMRKLCIASDWQTGLDSSRRKTSTNCGLFSLWKMEGKLNFDKSDKRLGLGVINNSLEIPKHALLVELIGAVLDVNFKMFGRVIE